MSITATILSPPLISKVVCAVPNTQSKVAIFVFVSTNGRISTERKVRSWIDKIPHKFYSNILWNAVLTNEVTLPRRSIRHIQYVKEIDDANLILDVIEQSFKGSYTLTM